jgi:cytochrome c oxidase assembly protein subunit 11
MRKKNRQLALYMGGLTLFTISFTYLSVPLYRIFCAKTGFAGTVKPQDQVRYEEKAKPVSGRRVLTVKFNADTSITMPWKFLPDQHEVKVLPGEAALAFFTAENKTNEPIIGVASYNIQPEGAALYFNKIQCFCFEEQMLKAREKVDMPVFFFIDPDFLADKGMDQVDTITLSYTFFKAGDADAPEVAGLHVPVLPARQKSTVGTSATDH